MSVTHTFPSQSFQQLSQIWSTSKAESKGAGLTQELVSNTEVKTKPHQSHKRKTPMEGCDNTAISRKPCFLP